MPLCKPIEFGAFVIQQIVEQQGPFMNVFDFFPDLSSETLQENRSWLEPVFVNPASQYVKLCVQSYIVRTRQHTILIDTCVGNHKPRANRPMWHMLNSNKYEQNFKAAGLSFEDIDFVMCTHLHTDHVGWNTKLENGTWVPTFPNARYVFSKRELLYWTQRAGQKPDEAPWMEDSVLPIVEAGMAEIVQSDHHLNDLVQLVPTPGHTIDHYSIHVGNTGNDAFLTGDMVHSPLQTLYPELGMFSDHDSAMAGATRRTIFERFCDTSTLVCTAHYPLPSTGRLTRWQDGFKIS